MATYPRIIVALDGLWRTEALELTRRLSRVSGIWGVKVNSLLRKEGYDLIDTLHDLGVLVMVDLKLADIPNTVRNDCELLLPHRPEIITIHASGGEEMMLAAVETLQSAKSKVVAISVLTSIKEEQCRRLYGKGLEMKVLEFAQDASKAGCWGMVCSSKELRLLRQAEQQTSLLPPGLRYITPGIRAAGAAPDDQARTMTAGEAIRAGADLLVIGRPIVQAPDPVAATARLAEEIEEALSAMAASG